MSKNFASINNDVILRAKIDPSDTNSTSLIMSDANDAIGIVASLRYWPELMKSGTISLVLADGDKDYPLNSDVDKIDWMGITVPTNNAIQLTYISRKNLANIILQKTIGGTAQPVRWYFDNPTVSSDNVATRNVSFNVMPDKAYTVKYFYKALPPQIVASTNYPFFNANFHYIIDFYCLWKYSERNPDPSLNPAYFRGEWENGVKELLANDNADVVENVPIPGPNPSISAMGQVPPLR